MQVGLCVTADCICQNLTYAAAVTCDSSGHRLFPENTLTLPPQARVALKEGWCDLELFTWNPSNTKGCLCCCECLCCTSEWRITWWFQGALEVLLETNYSTSGPTLWNIGDLLILLTYYYALSALWNFPWSFSASTTWKEIPSQIIYPDNLHNIIFPPFSL